MRIPRILLIIVIAVAAGTPAQLSSAAETPEEQFSLFDSWSAQHPAGKNDKSFGVWFGDFGNQAVAQTSYLVAEPLFGLEISAIKQWLRPHI